MDADCWVVKMSTSDWGRAVIDSLVVGDEKYSAKIDTVARSIN